MQNFLIHQIPEYIYGGIIVICISTLFFIDTSCWMIRSSAPREKIGFFTSRTNIYSYLGRLFTFIYMTFLSLKIDGGASVEWVSFFIFLSFLFGGIIQFLFLNTPKASGIVITSLARLLYLSLDERHSDEVRAGRLLSPLFFATFASTVLFCAGLSAPYVLASAIPEYRLTMSSLGQLLNAFGMLFILTYVDQKLFSAWDDGNLKFVIRSYKTARLIGISSSALVVLILYLSLRGG